MDSDWRLGGSTHGNLLATDAAAVVSYLINDHKRIRPSRQCMSTAYRCRLDRADPSMMKRVIKGDSYRKLIIGSIAPSLATEDFLLILRGRV